MLKRIILFLGILFYTLGAETLTTTDDKQWQSYFGVEGGVGNMSFCLALFASANPSMFKFNRSTFDWAYGAGIVGGWQKYTSEKVGMRNSFGFRIFVDPNTQALTEDRNKGIVTTELNLYYALDGLFDFVKNGDNHFGMSFGFSTDLLQLTIGHRVGFSGLIRISPRLGFYTQFDNHIIDLIASVPIVGFMDFGKVAYNSTLTLGYKYLF